MAECSLTRTEKLVVTKTVHTELTEDEARTLLSIMGNIAGHVERSPRRDMASIGRALAGALGPVGMQPQKRLLSGQLQFADYPNDAS